MLLYIPRFQNFSGVCNDEWGRAIVVNDGANPYLVLFCMLICAIVAYVCFDKFTPDAVMQVITMFFKVG